MVRWHHRLDGHEFEQAPGVGDGLGSLVCCSLWGHKESDMTEQHNKILIFKTISTISIMKEKKNSKTLSINR